MYCCSSEWIQFLGVTMKSCRFLQSKRQTSSKPYYQLLRWDSDCHLDGQLHTTPGEEDRLWLAMLVSHLHQLPPAAEGLVTLTMLVSVQQKPKDYFKLTSLCCFESQKSGKLQAQTQKLVLWDHLLMWEIGSSPEKILSVVFSTVSWTKLSLLFVFNNSSVNWKLQGIFPHVLTHCLHPLGCRSVTVGMAHALLTVLSTSFSRKQELKAFWLGKKKKKHPNKKERKETWQHWADRRGKEAVSPAPVFTSGWEYKYLLTPWPQRYQQLSIAFRPSGGRLASWINGFVASNDFITKKGGHWAWGDCWQPHRAALQYSLAQSPPQAPLSPVVHRAHLAAPCRFPRHRLPYDRLFFCQKTLNNIDLHVLASPLLMEHASAFTSN